MGLLTFDHDQLKEQQGGLGGLLVRRKIRLDAGFLFAPERRVGEDHVHTVPVPEFGQLHSEAVTVVDVRHFDPVQEHVHLYEAESVEEDGIRGRHGEEFRFTMLVVGRMVREAVYIQDQLRRVGVRMEISTRASTGLVFREMRTGDFEAAIWRQLMTLSTVRGHLAFFGEGSIIGYRNARVVELLDAAADTQNPEELDALYRELMSLFQEDLPVTFLYPMPGTYVVHRRVRGLSTPYRADPIWYMEELWIEDDSGAPGG